MQPGATPSLITHYFSRAHLHEQAAAKTPPFTYENLLDLEHHRFRDKQPWWALFRTRVFYLDYYAIVKYVGRSAAACIRIIGTR